MVTTPTKITTNGATNLDKTSDAATAVNPTVSGAIVKTTIGGTNTVTADNSATAGLGTTDDSGNLAAVTTANSENDRVAGDYGAVDVTDASNDSLAGTTTVDGQTVPGTAADIINDQGAVSTDSTDPQTRAAVLYATGTNTGISISVGGSNASATTFTLPSDIASTATVGTWDVTAVTDVGMTIKDDATGETFQITDRSYVMGWPILLVAILI